jgi:predicted dehydrogenase
MPRDEQMMSRICLVGAGKVFRMHAEALQGIPGHRIAAIVDADTAAGDGD